MTSTGTIPDTVLETQLNSHNQWQKAIGSSNDLEQFAKHNSY